MLLAVRSHLRHEEGQGLVEYGLVIVLVAIVVIATLVLMSGRLSTLFSSVAESV